MNSDNMMLKIKLMLFINMSCGSSFRLYHINNNKNNVNNKYINESNRSDIFISFLFL